MGGMVCDNRWIDFISNKTDCCIIYKNYENTITSELQLGTINKRFRIEQIRSIDDS